MTKYKKTLTLISILTLTIVIFVHSCASITETVIQGEDIDYIEIEDDDIDIIMKDGTELEFDLLQDIKMKSVKPTQTKSKVTSIPKHTKNRR